MAPRQSPLMGLQYDDTTGVYLAVLENQLASYAINEAKYRALLELLTGEPWDDVKLDWNGELLVATAVEALVKRGMDRTRAQTLVVMRWNAMNEPQPTPVPHAVPVEQVANTVADESPAVGLTMEQRLQRWKGNNQPPTESVNL